MTGDRDLVAAALPNYEIYGEIGRGGWGVVLHGRHTALGREVAIKQLPRAIAEGDSALERFVNEARIIGQLDHPHITKVYDFVEYDGLWLIVMEYLSGGTLWERFTEHGLRADQACAISMAVCAGLDAANQHGVLHRDIKPENILFTDDGVPRLGDFGIAKDLDVDMRRTRIGEVVGTPTYMSPEQAVGDELTRACDVYSVAVVLYELLAGRLPFEEARTPTQQLIQHATETPIPLAETAPDVPGPIADVVLKALEKRPEDRIATPQALGVALAHAAGETYGPGWLQQCGVPLMGGGPIQAEAHRSPTTGAIVVAPTFVRPEARADHFRAADDVAPDGRDSDGSTAAAAATIGPLGGSPAQERATIVPTAPSSIPPRETIAAPAVPSPSDGRRRRRLVVGGTLLAVLISIVFLVIFLGGSGDDDTSDADAVNPVVTTLVTAPPSTVQAAAVTATAPLAVADPVVTEPPVDETSPPAADVVAPQEHVCPVATRCTFIDSIAVDGDSVVIEWTAIGFEPSYQDGFIHAHFFWDVYSADQVGSNAGTFGVAQGAWEVTDQQPFRSGDEILVSNRPIPANQICVTAANFAHAVVNPLQFDCIPIPEDM